MEKKNKSFAVGMKHKRKSSFRGAASEPKNVRLDIADIPAIEIDNLLDHKTKIDIDISKTILPELDVPNITKKTSKKKAKKSIVNIGNNEIGQTPKKKKKLKRHSGSPELSPSAAALQKKKKKEKELVSEVHNLKVELGILGAAHVEKEDDSEETLKSPRRNPIAKIIYDEMNMSDPGNKFPILKDKELIEKFLKVPMSNNQKGRIRQAIRLSLQGSTTTLFPDVINGKIQALLSKSADLTDSELRRVRILYNMLKTALEAPEQLVKDAEEITPAKKKEKAKKGKEDEAKKDKEQKKVKGPKRYVVFLGNLPLNINKEKIMDHFRELNEHIVDIRLPKRAPDNKTAIAYVELSNEPTYELALSKHHSMLGTKRIKVLYTTQQKGKISREKAKSKSAKLIALQKAGKLIGSVPATKKRSHRRAIMKKAKAKEAADAGPA